MPVRLPVGCLVGEAVRRGELRRGEDIDLISLMDWISIVALSCFNNVKKLPIEDEDCWNI
jgi:hypothetical protein